MSLIYEPSGKAREYSPLALNIYNGCDHNCTYCYCKKMQYLNFSSNVKERPNFVNQLNNELNKIQIKNQVLLCFTGDPYCKFNDTVQLTRTVIMKLSLKNIPFAILSKGGKRILQDLHIFKKSNCKIGATLTCDNDKDSLKYEPGATLPKERLQTLKTLHENNIKTWISIEPVLFPEQSINLIKQSINYIDHYKIGKLNHNKTDIDWNKFLIDVVTLLRKNNKQFYIKDDLAMFASGFQLTQQERNMDYLALKVNQKEQLAFL